MNQFDITKKSRPVVVTDYQPRWVSEFQQWAEQVDWAPGEDFA